MSSLKCIHSQSWLFIGGLLPHPQHGMAWHGSNESRLGPEGTAEGRLGDGLHSGTLPRATRTPSTARLSRGWLSLLCAARCVLFAGDGGALDPHGRAGRGHGRQVGPKLPLPGHPRQAMRRAEAGREGVRWCSEFAVHCHAMRMRMRGYVEEGRTLRPAPSTATASNPVGDGFRAVSVLTGCGQAWP